MGELLKATATLIWSVFGVVGVVAVFVYLTPDQAQKWFAALLKLAMKVGIGAKVLHKTYVRFDFQGRVNGFINKNCPQLPGNIAQRVRLEWVDESVSKQAILDGDIVVVRVKRDDPQERSFVRAVCLYVSKSLLFKAKHYISAPQAEATDLLVSMRLLEKEKPATVSHFVEDYLKPATDDKRSAVARTFDDLVEVDKGRLFYAVYLQELNFLGGKVFGGRKDAVIAKEVGELIDFLKMLSNREVGADHTDLEFEGAYCKFAVVIVGKALKLQEKAIKPYVGFIKTKLIPSGAETIYLVSPEEKGPYLQQIAAEVQDTFEPHFEGKLRRALTIKGKKREVDTHILVLRSRTVRTYIERAG